MVFLKAVFEKVIFLKKIHRRPKKKKKNVHAACKITQQAKSLNFYLSQKVGFAFQFSFRLSADSWNEMFV